MAEDHAGCWGCGACSSPRGAQAAVRGTERWQLSSWPERDPADQRSKPAGGDTPGDAALDCVIGPPRPPPEQHGIRELHQQNKRMMGMLQSRADAPPPPSAADLERSRRAAFEMFQTMAGTVGYLPGFELGTALNAAGHEVDDEQVQMLRRSFGLAPGDRMTYQQFAMMCDMLTSGRVPASPPRQRGEEEAFEAPGSPRYAADKGSKPPPPAAKPNKGKGAQHHLWLESKVEIPNKVRNQFYVQKREEL
eukprot:TRINITY_DN24010_c0_g1_i1.p1 TRINITY_DN24010_c0_g1~~TRINITY_DN24010_c0_g1_i1.p1  ORF type:complete len:274 (+),score=101.09 TRINITY_DN24010_c0_g1_i1:77-823(+)